MPATTRGQNRVTTTIRPQAPLGVHDPDAVPPAHGRCHPEAHGGAPPLRRVRRGGACSPPRCLLGWDQRDGGQADALAAQIVREPTAGGHTSPVPRGQACLLGRPCIGGTHAAPLTRLRAHEEGVARVARLVAPVVGGRLFGLPRALAGSRRPSRPPRGDWPSAGAWGRLRRGAHAAAGRAGRHWGCAPAGCRTVGRRGLQVFAGAGALPTRGPCPSGMGGWCPEVTLSSPWSALGGQGAVADVRARRFVRGGPARGGLPCQPGRRVRQAAAVPCLFGGGSRSGPGHSRPVASPRHR